MMQQPKPRVAYILKMFPRLSETFVLNEVLELERQGVPVSVYSLHFPNDGRFHGRLVELDVTTQYFCREKAESQWRALDALPAEIVPEPERWVEAIRFLRRYPRPGDLELLMRSLHIAARARAEGVTHIHAHFATVSTRVSALVSMLTGIPFSFTAHAKDIYRTTVDFDLFAEFVDRAAFCVTVSDYNREHIIGRIPATLHHKVVRLYNGIDMSFFGTRPAPAALEVPHIVSVGRLVPKKGFDHLLRALDGCKRSGMAFRCTIAGDGEQRAELEALSRQLGLEAEVNFAGGMPHEQVRDLIAEASIVALACVADKDGNMDALPTVLLEALALDVPIVSTRLTGIPEIVDASTGRIVAPGDAKAFATALQEEWSAVRAGERPAGAGRKRCARLFDLRTNVTTLRGMFSQGIRSELQA